MTTNSNCITVHTLWQGDVNVHAARCRLRATDPAPVFLYQQHGRTIISRQPMLRVEFYCNEGRLTGVASQGAVVGGGAQEAVRADPEEAGPRRLLVSGPAPKRR